MPKSHNVEHLAMSGDVSSLQIVGERLADGTVKLGGGNIYPDWPAELSIIDLTFTLERVKRDKKYAPMEWGIYV